MPRELSKSQQGRKQCVKYRWTTLCVEGKRYGFSAWLKSRRAGSIPVPTGNARTLKTAMRNAKHFLAQHGVRR